MKGRKHPLQGRFLMHHLSGAANTDIQSKIAEFLGIKHPETLNRWLTGTTSPDDLTLEICARAVFDDADDDWKDNNTDFRVSFRHLEKVYNKEVRADPELAPNLARQFLESINTDRPVAESAIEPHLEIPENFGRNYHFSNRDGIEMLGRLEERNKLWDFLNTDARFSWLQIAGVAGQGKSRLALEIALEAEETMGWNSGFLYDHHFDAFAEQCDRFRPASPTLIIIDYVLGREKKVGAIFSAVERNLAHYNHNVRIILVERQRWDSSGENHESGSQNAYYKSSKSGWFKELSGRSDGVNSFLLKSRYRDSVVALSALDKSDLFKLVRANISDRAYADQIPDRKMEHHLNRIDQVGRPLYAIFLGTLLDKTTIDKEWTRDSLLSDILYRDMQRRWPVVFGQDAPVSLEDKRLSIDLAITATIVKQLDTRELSGFTAFRDADARIRGEAHIVTDREVDQGVMGSNPVVRALEPDILGEWFVLNSICLGNRLNRILEIAWEYNADETSAFIKRIAGNFREADQFYQIVNFIPSNAEARQAIGRQAYLLIARHLEEGRSYPFGILSCAEEAADDDDTEAIKQLAYLHEHGFMFQKGHGFFTDTQAAFKFYERAANQHDAFAMRQLSRCYTHSIGTNLNPDQAYRWMKNAFEKAPLEAACSFGLMYETGFGIKQDHRKAFELYKLAADAGDSEGWLNVGRCYYAGQGTKENKAKASYFLKLSADTGNSDAMYTIGMLHFAGGSLDGEASLCENDGQAVEWIRMAAERKSTKACKVLFDLYFTGRVVKKDINTAIEYLEVAANHFDSSAMLGLAKIYSDKNSNVYNGKMVKYWLDRAYHRNELEAVFLLGAFHLYDEFGERDEKLAVKYFSEGASKGDTKSKAALEECRKRGIGGLS